MAYQPFRLFNAKSCLCIYIKYIWFNLVWFHGISTIVSYLMPNPLYTYILNIYDLIWFGFMAYQPFRLFNAKSCLCIYIKYIWFNLVWFYGISTIVSYLMPNPLYTYILNIYDLIWFGFMAYQPFRLFNAKSCLCIYIKYIWFNLVWFYGISTIVSYLMPNPLYIYMI